MIILSILSVAIGVACLGYALYQGHERRRLQNYNRSEAWYLYSKTNNMTGVSQLAFQKYKEIYSDSLNCEMVDLLSQSSVYGLELFRETIRLIQLSENEFNHESIDRWQGLGKIVRDSHKAIFESIVVEDSKPINILQRIRQKMKCFIR